MLLLEWFFTLYFSPCGERCGLVFVFFDAGNLRQMDFEGATGRITLVPGTNDRANMPVQIFNSHGYKSDGKTVDFVSVGSVDPKTGELTLDEAAILWPGGTRKPPVP